MNIYSIYKITNTDNNKCYIGFTGQKPEKRFKQHLYAFNKTEYGIHQAIRKYGRDKFSFEVIYQSTDRNHTKNTMEPYFIEEYNTYLGEGYNGTKGGQGHDHSEETKRKIGESNKGNVAYINEDGVMKCYKPEDEIPEGFIPYKPHNYWTAGSIWAHNPDTGEEIRTNEIPDGFVEGRISGSGFSHLNDGSKKKYVNMKTKQYEFLTENEVENHHYRYDGHAVENIKCYKYKDYIALGGKNMVSLLQENEIDIPRKYVDDIEMTFPKPHHNMREDRKKFFGEYQGMTLKDLGVEEYKLTEIGELNGFSLYNPRPHQ